MKIVIDVDENIYHRFVSGFANEDDAYLIEQLFKNGKVLPKGHGRLIDADKLTPTCKFHGDCRDEKCEMCSDNAISFSDIETAPTILEADKGEEE